MIPVVLQHYNRLSICDDRSIKLHKIAWIGPENIQLSRIQGRYKPYGSFLLDVDLTQIAPPLSATFHATNILSLRKITSLLHLSFLLKDPNNRHSFFGGGGPRGVLGGVR